MQYPVKQKLSSLNQKLLFFCISFLLIKYTSLSLVFSNVQLQTLFEKKYFIIWSDGLKYQVTLCKMLMEKVTKLCDVNLHVQVLSKSQKCFNYRGFRKFALMRERYTKLSIMVLGCMCQNFHCVQRSMVSGQKTRAGMYVHTLIVWASLRSIE